MNDKNQKPPKSIRAIVADLRAKGELDEEKWARFKKKSLLVKALIIVVAVIGYFVCIAYELEIVAMILPIVAIVLLIIQYRDELFKVICMNLAEPVNINIISNKNEINIGAGGLAKKIRYSYIVKNQEYTFQHSFPASIFEDSADNTSILYNLHNPRKHIVLVPIQKNILQVFNLKKESDHE